MSFTTHRFRSQETMARAQDWLEKMGIPSDHIEVSSTGLPTLTISTEFTRIPAVDMVLNAVELTDPEGWPSFDTIGEPGTTFIDVISAPEKASQSSTTPIGWHPTDASDRSENWQESHDRFA